MSTLEVKAGDINDLKRWSDSLEHAAPQEVLRWAVGNYSPSLMMATAFGAEGCVLLAMLSEIITKPAQIRLINLDTGYQFQETLDLRDRIRDRYGISVEYIRAQESVEEMERRFGGAIYKTQPDICCGIRKVEPLKQVAEGYSAWITAIRRDQTHARKSAGIVEWDSKFQLVKVNPLANWTKRDVWQYITDHDVPYNPLHDVGYPSVGCKPCTHSVGVGDDDRAGRWANSTKTECGLHTR
ncbi:MAG: phosphoadenylyl-sulfate reductase [Armatimonadetes bacterium]|nr:phosphoadenylyl-sulfate reductase [Armatimonadota bacterium]